MVLIHTIASVFLTFICLEVALKVNAKTNDDYGAPWPDGDEAPYRSSQVVKIERSKRNAGKKHFQKFFIFKTKLTFVYVSINLIDKRYFLPATTTSAEHMDIETTTNIGGMNRNTGVPTQATKVSTTLSNGVITEVENSSNTASKDGIPSASTLTRSISTITPKTTRALSISNFTSMHSTNGMPFSRTTYQKTSRASQTTTLNSMPLDGTTRRGTFASTTHQTTTGIAADRIPSVPDTTASASTITATSIGTQNNNTSISATAGLASNTGAVTDTLTSATSDDVSTDTPTAEGKMVSIACCKHPIYS